MKPASAIVPTPLAMASSAARTSVAGLASMRQARLSAPRASAVSPARRGLFAGDQHDLVRRRRLLDQRRHVGAAAGNQDGDAARLSHGGVAVQSSSAPQLPAGACDRAAALARFDRADAEDRLAGRFELAATTVRIVGCDDHGHADAAVEGARHFVRRDVAAFLEQGEQRRQRPAAGIDDGVATVRQNPRNILEKSAAGDMRKAVDPALLGPAAAASGHRSASARASARRASAVAQAHCARSQPRSAMIRRTSEKPLLCTPELARPRITSPGAISAPVSTLSRSTAPTQKPARS